MSTPIWQVSDEKKSGLALTQFFAQQGLSSFEEAMEWSLREPNEFWRAVWNTTGIIGSPGEPAVRFPSESIVETEFFPHALLNIVDTFLQPRDNVNADAIVYVSETGERHCITWSQLRIDVNRATHALRQYGVQAGDRVAAWMPNRPETIVLYLATQALGAIFTSTSSDFGVQGVVDRFSQTTPRVLLAADAYSYGGKSFSCTDRLKEIIEALPSLEHVIYVETLSPHENSLPLTKSWNEFLASGSEDPFEHPLFPFNHPGLILYSSGTTGMPKCIVHKAAGVLLTHLKEQQLHCDIHPGDTVFYFTTCGWMMWNWLTSALATGATIVLFDGNPAYPNLNTLFDLCEQENITLFGTSAKFIDSCRKAELSPTNTHRFPALRTICSTGSPLNAAGFEWVYEHFAADVHLASISGGTDLCGCFVGGDPSRPVYAGEIQSAMLGMDVSIYNDSGEKLLTDTGELVCRNAFPSMPNGFWGDATGEKYHNTYFSRFENTWTHGDFASRTANNGFVIHGRSDATLNVGGVRMGTAEIYSQVETFVEIIESVAVAQEWDDDTRIVLFLRMAANTQCTPELEQSLRQRLRQFISPRHVPALIIPVSDIPRTRSGKISELAVTDIVNGRPVRNTEALANPECLKDFIIPS
ncbi:MAG: acetoacetate--CoA ligase [Actinobacteria bacterium]|nr:acetoacetate--CoA ligase [Actinomycetota bacterium]